MSQLQRLRDRLAEERHHTAIHPLDDTVAMRYRAPTPEEYTRSRGVDVAGVDPLVARSAGLLAFCFVGLTESDTQVADLPGRDLAEHIGMRWRTADGDDPGSQAADVIVALYGDAWQALTDDARAVMALTKRRSDPSS